MVAEEVVAEAEAAEAAVAEAAGAAAAAFSQRWITSGDTAHRYAAAVLSSAARVPHAVGESALAALAAGSAWHILLATSQDIIQSLADITYHWMPLRARHIVIATS
jgi:hypothetical protein